MSKADLGQDFFELGDKTSLVCADPGIDGEHPEYSQGTRLQNPFRRLRGRSASSGYGTRNTTASWSTKILQAALCESNAVMKYLAPLPMAHAPQFVRLPDWRLLQYSGCDAGICAKRACGRQSVGSAEPDGNPEKGPGRIRNRRIGFTESSMDSQGDRRAAPNASEREHGKADLPQVREFSATT